VIYKNLPQRSEVAWIKMVGMRELVHLRKMLPMIKNALKEHFGFVSMGHHMMEAVGPDQIVCADHLDYRVP
jgi:hypothetical protein